MRRAILLVALAVGALGAVLVGWGAVAGADGSRNDANPVPSDLTGIALVKQLGLREIPPEGTSKEAGCAYAAEVEGVPYCLDPVAKDWTEARLVAAQIRGADINDEMRTAAEAQADLLAADDAYTTASSSDGASADEIASLRSQMLDARARYEQAVAAWEKTQE